MQAISSRSYGARDPKVRQHKGERNPAQDVQAPDSSVRTEADALVRTADQIAALMATYAIGFKEQLKQTAYRLQLANHWSIEPGSKVLEIGCGQGDTTAVLAELVGEQGSVLGVDPARPDYGSPISIGQSAQHLEDGPYGPVLDIRLNFSDWSMIDNHFDYAVMSHCSWYFDSFAQLLYTLKEARSRSAKLCFAEWSLEPLQTNQIPHYCAIIAQSLIAKLKPDLQLNIQNPFPESVILDALSMSGWKVESRHVVERPNVDDGHWEVQELIRLAERTDLAIPSEVQAWLMEQANILKGSPTPYASLPSFGYVCS
ncbi:MAG: class I SAM-dependent methyltransferase [Fimbriimonadaceae bacterium]